MDPETRQYFTLDGMTCNNPNLHPILTKKISDATEEKIISSTVIIESDPLEKTSFITSIYNETQTTLLETGVT